MKKIELYRKRTFSDIFEDSIEWLKENRSAMLRYIVPVVAVGTIVISVSTLLSHIKSQDMYSVYDESDINFAIPLIVLGISQWLLPTLIYALYRLYQQRENGLQNVSFNEFRGAAFSLSIPMLIVLVVDALCIIAFFVLLNVNVFSALSIVIPIVLFPLFMYPAIVAINNNPIESLKEAFVKGFNSFFTLVKIVFAMLLFGGLLFLLCFTSYGIIELVTPYLPKSILHIGEINIAECVGIFITIALITASAYFLILLSLVVALHTYGSMKEDEEGTSFEKEIDNFENL